MFFKGVKRKMGKTGVCVCGGGGGWGKRGMKGYGRGHEQWPPLSPHSLSFLFHQSGYNLNFDASDNFQIQFLFVKLYQLDSHGD